jgi:hypothetical protein
MTQDRPLVASATGESEVDRRYQAILRDLLDLLPDHDDLLTELDAVVSELLAEADDRARTPSPARIRTEEPAWEAFAPVLPPPAPIDGPPEVVGRSRPCTQRGRPNR